MRLAKVGGAALIGCLLAGALTPPIASATCTNNTLTPGDRTISITSNNRTRSYLLHVPASYDGTKAVPLVIDIHGFTSNASEQRGLSGWLQKSDQVGFIAAWPQGLNNSWNAYGCCGTSDSFNVDDVGFIRRVVADIVNRGKIDQSRIYATGLSNGGSMSHRLACEANDIFAATAPVSFTLNASTRICNPARPITVVHFHGFNDDLVPYDGSGSFQSAPDSFAEWRQIDGCNASLSTVTFGAGPDNCQTATTCSAGVTPTLCSLSGSHVLYNTQSTMDIASYAWDNFFSKITRAGAPTCQ